MPTKRVVGFSGGADSQAVLELCLDRFPKDEIVALNSQAGGNEHPITTEFVEWYSANVHPIIVVPSLIMDLGDVGNRDESVRARRNEFAETDELTFERLSYIKGVFPSGRAQFCTEYLKLAPARRWMRENIDQSDAIEYYSGVRRGESKARADTPDRKWDGYFDCEIVFPVAQWSKDEVFAYLKSKGRSVNPLYLMGFSRVGCAPCIRANKDDMREWAARAPEMIDKIRGWEERLGKPFWHGGRNGMIDEVADWSRTSHGGKQPLLMFEEADTGACSSVYGLCE